MKKKIKILFIYSSTLIGIIIWLGIIFWAPYLKSRSSGLNVFIYAIFSPLCHQIQSRSFFLFEYPIAVCARCLGIYFGFLAGTGLFPFLREFSNLNLPKIRTFILMSLPIVIDAMGSFFSFWVTSNWFRFITGFIWGVILPFYFITGIADFLVKRTHTKDF